MEITSPLICPQCQSRHFETVADKLECSSCGTYPVVDEWRIYLRGYVKAVKRQQESIRVSYGLRNN